jgi:hypothetical protein
MRKVSDFSCCCGQDFEVDSRDGSRHSGDEAGYSAATDISEQSGDEGQQRGGGGSGGEENGHAESRGQQSMDSPAALGGVKEELESMQLDDKEPPAAAYAERGGAVVATQSGYSLCSQPA